MGPRRVPRAYLVLLSVSSWGAGGCLGLAGDFDIPGPDARGEDARAVTRSDADASAPLSTDPPDGVAPRAAVPACLPDQYVCSGPDLQICNSNQDGYVTLQKCAKPGDCSASLKTCAASPPPPGGGNGKKP